MKSTEAMCRSIQLSQHALSSLWDSMYIVRHASNALSQL